MNWLKRTYTKAVDNLGKVLSTFGATLIGLDIAGYADQVKLFAGQYLGDKAAQKVGMLLFLLLLARTTWTGMVAARLKRQSLPQSAR